MRRLGDGSGSKRLEHFRFSLSRVLRRGGPMEITVAKATGMVGNKESVPDGTADTCGSESSPAPPGGPTHPS